MFGKWCRPNYNSAVATFCNNIANDLPIQVNDPTVELELLYIDDLVAEMISALKGKVHRCEFNGLDVVPSVTGTYCYCPITHKVTLGEIVDRLHEFADQPLTLMMPEIPAGSFVKKLYSTFLSYLPESKVAFPFKMNIDARGSSRNFYILQSVVKLVSIFPSRDNRKGNIGIIPSGSFSLLLQDMD